MKKVWFELAVLNWVKKAAVTVNDTYLNRLVFCCIVGKLNKWAELLTGSLPLVHFVQFINLYGCTQHTVNLFVYVCYWKLWTFLKPHRKDGNGDVKIVDLFAEDPSKNWIGN